MKGTGTGQTVENTLILLIWVHSWVVVGGTWLQDTGPERKGDNTLIVFICIRVMGSNWYCEAPKVVNKQVVFGRGCVLVMDTL